MLLKITYFRASVEAHTDHLERIPPVTVTIANNNVDFIIRISDRGGGIKHHDMKRMWDYGFTTSGENQDERLDRGLLSEFIEDRSAGAMHG